jgi:hypothetical protein
MHDLVSICSLNLTDAKAHGALAVTQMGIDQLETDLGLSEGDLFQLAMASRSPLDESLQRQLLFGLLMRRGGLVLIMEANLTVEATSSDPPTLIKEDRMIIAPVPEISFDPASLGGGEVSFLDNFGPQISHDPPDLEYFCFLKNKCGGHPVHQLLKFILHKLRSLPVEDSLLGQPFRLKSYSSTINKLFYRGKPLTDLLAATVGTDDERQQLTKELSQRGAMRLDSRVTGNNDIAYLFVRILQVKLEGSPQPHSFTLPVYYKVIKTHYTFHEPPELYELNRLNYNLTKGQMNMLRLTSFTLEKF